MEEETKARRAAPSRKPGRTPWGTISREQIVSTAVKALKETGYGQMTIRGLAADMGVAPMSLYRHVRDKDDILDEVVERMLAGIWRPEADPGDWKGWVLDASDKLRHFLVTEPAALHVYLAHPVVSPSALERMEAMTAVLRAALVDEQAVRRAYAAIQTYTIGFAALEASRSGWDPSGAGVSDHAKELAAFTTRQQFFVGLRYLLDGMERGQPPGDLSQP